jgi:zeta-carotene desaturase
MKVAVIGGGVSGLRAALTLARGGCDVTLVEKNRHLGGRVFSFQTPDFGEVDIGQHIWLRCCTYLEGLLSDLSVPDAWVYRQQRVAMTYRWLDGSAFLFSAGKLPGNLALLPALLRLPGFGWTEKLQYLAGMARAALYSDQQLQELDQVSFADWLRAQRQPASIIRWFWEPLIAGVCNGRLAEVSARHGLFTVRESVIKSPAASAICLLRCPLSAVFDRLAHRALQDAGVKIHTGIEARELQPGAQLRVAIRNGPAAEFDRIVLALPLKRMKTLLPNAHLPPPPQEGAIAGLLLRFARPVMDELFFTAADGAVQHVFNKTAIWHQEPKDGSQIIELVLSAAEREVKLGAQRVTAELLPELGRLLPRVRQTGLLAKRLLVHGTATFRVVPGGEAQRLPLVQTSVPGVVFAGDYAGTGWPSTMESAVRAGEAAAQFLLEKGVRNRCAKHNGS